MAKTKTADNKFEPGEWYLCRIISARLTSHPTVDPGDPGVMVEVKLSVLIKQRPDVRPQICGRQAVVFITVKKGQGHLLAEGGGCEFLLDFGIRLSREGHPGDLIDEEPFLLCRFGERDSVHGFQSITSWKPADDEFSMRLISQAVQSGSSRRRLPGLSFPREKVVARFKSEVNLKSMVQWHFLKTLEARYPEPVSFKVLAHDVWDACDLEPPSPPYNSIHQVVCRLKRIITPLKVGIETTRSQSYRLVDLRKRK
jgi:hypothetical protein